LVTEPQIKASHAQLLMIYTLQRKIEEGFVGILNELFQNQAILNAKMNA
jgi:hypothetical protein